MDQSIEQQAIKRSINQSISQWNLLDQEETPDSSPVSRCRAARNIQHLVRRIWKNNEKKSHNLTGSW